VDPATDVFPEGQAVHEEIPIAFADEYVPIGQLPQLAPATPAKVPALQTEHVEPPVELLPVGHKVQPFKLLVPLLEVLPSGQLIHPDKSVLEYLPAGQDVQEAPDVLYSPALQFTQVAPARELFPSGQLLHAFPFALFPAGQLAHSLACDVPTPGDD